MNTLTFNDVNFNPVERNGQIWLTSGEIAKALGYKNTKSISNLYSANADEFTPAMTEVIDSVTSAKTKGLKVSFNPRARDGREAHMAMQQSKEQFQSTRP